MQKFSPRDIHLAENLDKQAELVEGCLILNALDFFFGVLNSEMRFNDTYRRYQWPQGSLKTSVSKRRPGIFEYG